MFSLMANCFTWIKLRKEPIKKITILMVGLDNAGKTSTVADLKGDSLDGITPTVGFLMSTFNMQRFNVTVFDLGGGPRIRAIWKTYYAEVYGVVFVVDASDRDRIEECRRILHETKQSARISGKPLLILANKQDIEGAMTEEEIYRELDLGSLIAKHKCPCQVYTCTACLGEGKKIDRKIKKGFQWLLSEVSNNFSTLTQRVERDMAEQKRIDEQERQARKERVRKQREEREKEEQEAAERANKVGEESDDDVIVGKGSRKSPDANTPEKKKKKKKKKKVIKKESSLDTVDDDTVPTRISKEIDSEALGMNGLQRRLRPLDRLEDRGIDRPGRLEPLTSPEQNETDDGEVRKKKKKKKKRRTNKTAPLEEDPDEGYDLPSVTAWGTPPGTMNGFTSSSKGVGQRLEPLGTQHYSGSAFGAQSIQESDEEPKPLAPIRNKSWTRTRPNSDDHDVIT